MLQPADRLTLAEQIRPPQGFKLENAVITTYSLDLLALMAVPLAFTFFDREVDSDGLEDDALPLLEAVRRYADRILVFCHSGQIQVPRASRPLLAYLEDSVFEALPPRRGTVARGAFHPKLWILRYIDDAGHRCYRILCMSRNLTFDRSWDVSLCLDGSVAEHRVRGYASNRPLTDFVEALPSLAVRDLTPVQAAVLSEFGEDLRRVRWDVPQPFEDSVTFWPMGHTGRASRPIAGPADRLLVISPFVNSGWDSGVREIGSVETILISQSHEIDALPAAIRDSFSRTLVLIDDAERAAAESEETPDSGFETPLRGLHAKVWLAESGWNARMWVGSANATRAAFTRNVEFLCELRGKRSRIGINQMLQSTQENNGLADILLDYEPTDPAEEPREEETTLLDQVRALLAEAALRAEVEPTGDGYIVTLTVECTNAPLLRQAGMSARPITLADTFAQALKWDGNLLRATFRGLTLESISSFFVFELTSESEPPDRLRFVRRAELVNPPAGRREALLKSMLDSPSRVMQYLFFLLAGQEEAELGAADSRSLTNGNDRGTTAWLLQSQSLLEAFARALARDPARIDEVNEVVSSLRSAGTDDLLPEEFAAVWDSVVQAREALRGEPE